MSRNVLFIFFLLIPVLISGQKRDFKTISYFGNDSLTLELDLFTPGTPAIKSPLVIFLHGGAFSGGMRSNGHPFCRNLSENGIVSATISYSLSMKGKSFNCDGNLTEKIKAIQLAAHQARLATIWFIKNASDLGIDTNSIFLAGSSAGAEAVLHAGFLNPSEQGHFSDSLSGSFRYAGIISGAGALLDINMITCENKIPVLSYHGTCDPLVPYYIAPHHYCSQNSTGYMMMFGSHAIHDRLQFLHGSSQLMTFCNEGHKHAGTPFDEAETSAVVDFIQRTLMNEKFIVHRIFNNGDTCEHGFNFEFCR